MSVAIKLALKVDRIRMVKGIPNKTLSGVLAGNLWFLEEENVPIVPGGAWKIMKWKYKTQAQYSPTKGRKIVDIEVGSTKSSTMYFAIDLYTGKILPNELYKLSCVLDAVFVEFGLSGLFAEGRVTYLELASDWVTEPMYTFIPFRKRCRASEIFVKGGVKGSIYIGSRHSNLRFCIYDKKKEMLEKGKGPCAELLRTRIEARLSNLKLSASQISLQLPNPFLSLQIADESKSRHIVQCPVWHAFLDRCLQMGSCAAVSTETKHYRKLFMQRLGQAAAWWWKPSALWAQIGDAMARIEPMASSPCSGGVGPQH